MISAAQLVSLQAGQQQNLATEPCYGVCLMPATATDSSQFPLLVTVIESTTNKPRSFLARPGVYYQWTNPANQILCTAVAACNLYAEIGTDPRDFVNAAGSSGAGSSTFQTDVWLIPAGTSIILANKQTHVFTTPVWAKKGTLWVMAGTSGVGADANISGAAAPYMNVAVPIPAGALITSGNARYISLAADAQIGMATSTNPGAGTYVSFLGVKVASWGVGVQKGTEGITEPPLFCFENPPPPTIMAILYTAAAAQVNAGQNLPVWMEWSA